MPLLLGTQQQYYGSESFTATAGQTAFVLTFPKDNIGVNNNPTMPLLSSEFSVAVNGVAITTFTYNATTFTVTLDSAASVGDIILVTLLIPNVGNYQFISLTSIMNNFLISYVGEEKIIPKVKRADVAFHAQRAIQELSYDTFKSTKSQEIEVPPSLKMALPHDYVNYVKISWIDTDGIERLLYPARKTGNPTAILQDDSSNYLFGNDGNILTASDSDAWIRYSAQNQGLAVADVDKKLDLADFDTLAGGRFGIEPENAQFNGIFFIDNGYIHFSSSMNTKTVVLKYISDGIATEDEMIVHKFAEEAVYKWIAHAILATRINVPEYMVARFKKERFAAIRTAKLRLSNLKIEELTQIMRGKSKWIKH